MKRLLKLLLGRNLKSAQLHKWTTTLLATQPTDKFCLSRHELSRLCALAKSHLTRNATILRLPAADYIIVGDIHGQFTDLVHILNKYGLPPGTNYIFLGDYVDRGPCSLEVMALLLTLKLLFPDNIHLLRGNHESESISSLFGFQHECQRRCGNGVWENFVQVFNVMSLAAVIDSPVSAFCVHGGISPHVQLIDDMQNHIKRPAECSASCGGIVADLLWADPSPEIDNFGASKRGMSFEFGLLAAKDFLNANKLKRIIRGHTMEDDGFRIMGPGQEVITVFSAPNFKNLGGEGAVMVMAADGTYKLEIMHEIIADSPSASSEIKSVLDLNRNNLEVLSAGA